MKITIRHFIMLYFRTISLRVTSWFIAINAVTIEYFSNVPITYFFLKTLIWLGGVASHHFISLLVRKKSKKTQKNHLKRVLQERT